MEGLPNDLFHALAAINGISPERLRAVSEDYSFDDWVRVMQSTAVKLFRTQRADDHHAQVLQVALDLIDRRCLNERNLVAALADATK